MLAASAHITNAKPAAPGDGPAASQPSGTNVDGFSGALASLMAQLGPPAPVTPPTTTTPSSDHPAEAGGGNASGRSTPASASDPSAGHATPAQAASAAANANANVAPPTAGQGDASDALAVSLLGQVPPATAPDSGAAETTIAAVVAIRPQAAQLDPRLIPFAAKPGAPATAPAAAPAAAAAVDPGAAATTATQPGGADAANPPPPAAAASLAPAATLAVTLAADPTQAAVPTAALLTLAPGQLLPISARALQPATPAKSSKAAPADGPAAAGAARTLAPAASPASLVAISEIAAPADAQSDAAFTLAHDGAAGQDLPQDAQPTAGAPGGGTQISPQTAPPAALAMMTGAAPASAALASAHGAEITAQLAAQISGRASAARTAFDFALEPQGLGRVDVTLKIDPHGQLSAVLSFDNPSAAAEAKSRAGDLQQALQQAGINVGQSGLSFTSGGGHGHGAAWQVPAQTSYAQAPVLTDPGAEAAPVAPRSARGAAGAVGLDITI